MKKQKNTEVETTIEIEETTTETVTNQGLESNVETSFFYTNDKFINQMDDNVFYDLIISKYPNLNLSNADTILKKTLAQFLEDEEFVEYILEFYNISIYDLFKVLYRMYGALFNTLYSKKIRSIIETKNYAKCTKPKKTY